VAFCAFTPASSTTPTARIAARNVMTVDDGKTGNNDNDGEVNKANKLQHLTSAIVLNDCHKRKTTGSPTQLREKMTVGEGRAKVEQANY